MKVDQALLTALIAAVFGWIGSVTTPLIKWNIEKRKMRFEKRVEIIKELKAIATEDEFNRVKFINSANYTIVRKHLKPKTIETIERPLNHIRVTIGKDKPAVDHKKKIILEDLAKIEKKWKII